MEKVLLLGATSGIARAIAHRHAQAGDTLYLAARNRDALAADAADLQIRYGVAVHTFAFDACQYDTHATFYAALPAPPTCVYCIFGYLGNQETAQSDAQEARKILETNFNAAVSILEIAAAAMEQRRSGSIIGISSVAGDRGRASNYFYGSAKAGFTTYLSGLRNRLASSGVHVLTVKPGFVATRMTEGMNTPAALTAQPQQVAADVYRALQRRQNVLYTRWFWRYIMLIIQAIPENIFKKLKL